jgi:hypothetical protein
MRLCAAAVPTDISRQADIHLPLQALGNERTLRAKTTWLPSTSRCNSCCGCRCRSVGEEGLFRPSPVW